VVLVLAVVGAPFFVLEIVSAVEGKRTAVESAELQILAEASATAAGLAEFLSGLRGSLEAIAQEDPGRLLDPTACAALIEEVSLALPSFTHMGVADTEGGMICATAPVPLPMDTTVLAWVDSIGAGRRFVVSPPVPGPITDVWSVLLGVPILDETGAFRGIVSGSIQLGRIQDLVERVRPTADRLVTVATLDAVVVARSHDADRWVGRTLPDMGVAVETVTPGRRFITRTQDAGGRERVWGRVDLDHPPWRVFVGAPTDEVEGPRLARLQSDVATDLLVLGLALMMALFLVRGITRSFALLADGVRKAEPGAPVAIPEDAPPEIRLVATQLNQTLAAIERAEAAERAAHQRYQQIVDNAVFGIYVSNMDGRFLQVNPAFVSMTGYGSAEELMSAGAEALYRHPGKRPELMANSLARGYIENIEVDWRRKDGRPLLARLNGTIMTLPGGDTGFEVIVEDITRQRDLEELTRHQQKMEAVGRLAGGVAHEFNNLLTVLGVSSEILANSLDEDDPLRSETDEIQAALEHAAALTRKLLAFSRKEVAQPRVFDLAKVLLGLEGMLRRVIGDQIELELRPMQGECRVTMDAGHLEQVILNLMLNARDAMPTGGRIVLGTECRAAFPRRPESQGDDEPRWYAVVTVSDDGAGMAPGVKAHIFEPFFTTKPVGEGTGLGLSTVHGIVAENGGWIEVDSEQDAGSRFSVWLPLTLEDTSPPPDLPSGDGATVLVGLQDSALRHMVRLSLEPLGYEVLEASSPADALDLFWRSNKDLDLLVTSRGFPGLSERSLLERLREEQPSLEAIWLGEDGLTLPFGFSALAAQAGHALAPGD
jgi:PAS domain S-box-containing protein